MSSLSTILAWGFFFGSNCFGASISWGIWDIMLMFWVAHNLLARSDIVPPHLRPSERSSTLMVSALNSLGNCCGHEILKTRLWKPHPRGHLGMHKAPNPWHLRVHGNAVASKSLPAHRRAGPPYPARCTKFQRNFVEIDSPI
jgi:hypothetical protein